MEALVHWFSQNLSQYISPEGAVFIISMIPLLELRGGLLAASLLKISAAKAIPLCIVGNIIPIPFILLFIRQIFKVLKKTKLFRGLVMKLEDRAMRKSDQVKKYEFWGLMLFVGIPLPGTGAWTGSLIASLLEIDIKKSSLAIFCGIIMATVIMYIVSYGLVGNLVVAVRCTPTVSKTLWEWKKVNLYLKREIPLMIRKLSGITSKLKKRESPKS